MNGKMWVYTLLLVAIAITIFARYEEYVVRSNFYLFSHVPCDTASETCFVPLCEEGGTSCDATPFKKIAIKANLAPSCILENNCDSFACPDGESGCRIQTCKDSDAQDGETCSIKMGP